MLRATLRGIWILVLAVTLAVGPIERAAADEKEDNIREIIELTGVLNITEQMLDLMLAQLEPAFAKLNPGEERRVGVLISAELKQVFAENMGDFVELTVLAYAAHFSAEEIAELLAFYQTPLGQRLIEELPELMVESQAAGMQWGRALGTVAVDRVRKRLAAEGLETRI